jgi:hypothetical protein
MDYFKHIPDISYKFGNQSSSNTIVDLTAYVSIIDEVKDNVAFYNYFYVREGYRPDQVSIQLYGTPVYHWTFFMMNDNLKEFGWPLSQESIFEKAVHTYQHIAMQTTADLTTQFKIGQTVTGTTSGATGTIAHRDLDLGIIYVTRTSNKDFRRSTVTGEYVSENINSTVVVPGGTQVQSTTVSISEEYNSPAYYTLNGERTDFDPRIGPGALLTEVTRLEKLVQDNEDLRRIRVIKPNIIGQVVSSVRQALNS